MEWLTSSFFAWILSLISVIVLWLLIFKQESEIVFFDIHFDVTVFLAAWRTQRLLVVKWKSENIIGRCGVRGGTWTEGALITYRSSECGISTNGYLNRRRWWRGAKNNSNILAQATLAFKAMGPGRNGWQKKRETSISNLRYLKLVPVNVSGHLKISPVASIAATVLTFILGRAHVGKGTKTLMNESSLKVQWRCSTLSLTVDNYFVVQWKLISTPRFLLLSHNRCNYISRWG